jgi:hypothetical protein
LVQSKKKGYSASLLFGFNIRSNTVLYQLLTSIQHQFGHYTREIPFRIDAFQKQWKQQNRSGVYREMVLARNKIRLFYGQLTSRKLSILLSKTKSAFSFIYGAMERRLDVLLVRADFCRNIFSAQQLVRHGHITVNGKVLRNFFYPIRWYDFVSFKKKETALYFKFLIFTKMRLNKFRMPVVPYLVINYDLMVLYTRPFIDARCEVGFTAPASHNALIRN